MLRRCLYLQLAVGIAATAWAQPTQPAPETPTPATQSTPPLELNRFIQPGDRILFVGDELTQQMFYTRAVACALLAIMPEADLRFFNGGRDGATADSAAQWVDDLMGLCNPTVTFVCLGLNDGKQRKSSQPISTTFQQSLSALVKKIQAHPTVREVVILSPPPVQAELAQQLAVTSYNWTLLNLGAKAQQVAAEHNAGFIDLFSHMKNVYLASSQIGGESLTHDGRLPTETGHTVIASIILRGIGVPSQQLDPMGWSPIPPIQMRRVRQALALQLQPASLEAAQISRALYTGIQPFDEAFFRLWRLSAKRPARKEQYQAQMQRAWAAVQDLANHHREPVAP